MYHNIFFNKSQHQLFYALFDILFLMNQFEDAYKKLNSAQKEAVDTIDGPVMVVAGPGTGKTQVLALRIANILTKHGLEKKSILCLTFTRAGVTAMNKRLATYIGDRIRDVSVMTFHGFATSLIEKHYSILDFDVMPTLLDDMQAIFLIDDLLHKHEWQHLRPRGNASMYFNDLKSLVSLMKRERLTPEYLLQEIEKDIENLKTSPESISSRGESKGSLKKEVLKKIESLDRTREVVTFYTLYEQEKKIQGVMDYDDVLEYAVRIVEISEDARAEIKEEYLYVLIDEHQDSSGVQNKCIRTIWQGEEKPNIFVVGDDRQLIYGFGGASLSYFEEFKTTFGKARYITLTENYRSTKPILHLADTLLQSVLTTDTLKSNRTEEHAVLLEEYTYPRDEILGAGLFFKNQIKKGLPPEKCALLVPKNHHVREAVEILKNMGLPVRSSGSVSFFSVHETDMFRRVLSIVADPMNEVSVGKSLFDITSNIPPLVAHGFLRSPAAKNLSVQSLLHHADTGGLFDEHDPIVMWGKKLEGWIEYARTASLVQTIQHIGNELCINTADDHEVLIRRVEVVRTMIHLGTERLARHPKETMKTFVEYLNRLEEYNHTIPLAVLEGSKGISVLTLHGSKGLEYDSVWIAHMNESTLMAQKRLGFTLPESIAALIEEKDIMVAKREVYVAITRAERMCALSYAFSSHTGSPLELAHVVAGIPKTHFIQKTKEETEQILLEESPSVYIDTNRIPQTDNTTQLIETVRDEYAQKKVSVTLLNNFFECPWKWYFRNLLQLPEAKTDSLHLGSAVHETIEYILKQKVSPTKSLIKEQVLLYFEKNGIQEGETLSQMIADAIEIVTRFVSMYMEHVAKDYVTERPVSCKDVLFPELTMYGKLDLTERFPDGSVCVTDFKTGKAKTKNEIEKRDDEQRLSSYMRQLAMYAYLIRTTEKSTDTVNSRLLFLEADTSDKNALFSKHIEQEEIDLLLKDIADYSTWLKDGSWIHRPCHFKAYGSGAQECTYCAQAKRVYGI